MGRRRTIDRDKVLEAAEEAVARLGADLSIDAVATAAGITKGGVQSCFGTKDKLIEAMLQRWFTSYNRLLTVFLPENASAAERVRAHVEATKAADEATNVRSSGLLECLLRSPENLARKREWYSSRIAGLDMSKHEDRRARLAFLATEGLFFLRYSGLMQMENASWDSACDDILELL